VPSAVAAPLRPRACAAEAGPVDRPGGGPVAATARYNYYSLLFSIMYIICFHGYYFNYFIDNISFELFFVGYNFLLFVSFLFLFSNNGNACNNICFFQT
jgi:hypothetical protein